MVAARKVVDNLVDRGFKEGHVAYGINSGFGLFSDVVIEHDKLKKLQVKKMIKYPPLAPSPSPYLVDSPGGWMFTL